MARPAIARRPALDRAGHSDRSGTRHVPRDGGSAAAPAASSVAFGPHVPEATPRPTGEEIPTEVSPAAYWALLPAAEKERLGLRLSQLVLKAVRPPITISEEDGQ
jgi:hypothetical protein